MGRLNLSDAGNVTGAALWIIREKGYRLRLVFGDDLGIDPTIWIAERGEYRFNGSDPLSLLGLICVGEAKGHGWRLTEEENRVVQEYLDRSSEEGMEEWRRRMAERGREEPD